VGKRSNFKRRERDFYPTPAEAIDPILLHLPARTLFDEPCVGGGHLVRCLEAAGHLCVSASDLASGQDAMGIQSTVADCFITNPPWKWEVLNPLITHLSSMAPCWLLLNGAVAHNKRMAVHMARCVKFVSVGRCSWMANGVKGYEDAAWFLFDANHKGQTEFYARAL